jgi:hypothetical protein
MESCREFTGEERALVRWMLERGGERAAGFLAQVEEVVVTPWRCKCGCASLQFAVRGGGGEERAGGMMVLADFVFGEGEGLGGIFVYAQDGVLSGVEVYGLGGEAATSLPGVEALRPFGDGGRR